MKLFAPPIDLTSVNTVVYHLPDGPALSLKIDGIEEYLDLELELGHICDTSNIDGVLSSLKVTLSTTTFSVPLS